MNNRIHIYTKEDIERFGFIYEPDETKCKTGKIKVFYGGFHQKDGKITPQPFRREWDQVCPEEDYKKFIVDAIYLKYINDVFVVDPEPIPGMDNFHGDVWVMISGHTRIKSKGEEEYEKKMQSRMG